MKYLFVTLLVFFFFMNHSLAQPYRLNSPNDRLSIIINSQNGISWSAQLDEKEVIPSCKISMILSDDRLLGSTEIVNSETLSNNQIVWPVVPTKAAELRDHYNQLTLTFKENHQLIFRAYDAGIAYRFVDNNTKAIKVLDEKMELEFPSGTFSYFPKEESMYSHNERTYLQKGLDSLNENDFCSLPVMFETPDTLNILFTESALYEYPGMFLKGSEDNTLQTQFPPFVLEAIPNTESSPDRNQFITKEAKYIAKTSGSKAFPWRVFMISDDPGTFLENDLVFLLSEENQLENTDWINPGKVAWDWYNANNIFGVDFKSGLNTKTYKYYIDFAAENGIEYVILDEGWTKSTTQILAFNPEMDVPELIRYGNEKNVGIILWVLWKPLNENLEKILDTYSNWGAKGIKVDFMQRSDQYVVSSYEQIAMEAAKRGLLVDFHGAFKPSGIRRKYPNLLTYEGVKGNEHNKWSADITPIHTTTIPFIRMAAGPMDFTPGSMLNHHEKNYHISFERPVSMGTRCHQVAMYIVFESPLQMMCENPSIYRKEQETVDFITQIPTTWDETIALEAAIGKYVVLARRKEDSWYIAAMTNWESREFEIELDFLKGDFEMILMKDGINADRYAEDYVKETRSVSAGEKINISMAQGGGWAAILKPIGS